MNVKTLETYVKELKPSTKAKIIGILGSMVLSVFVGGAALLLAATPMAPLVPSLETGLLEESTILGPSIASWITNAITYG